MRASKRPAAEIDIRHGEWALFEIGRLVTSELMENFSGYVVLDDSDKKQYEHNIPLGARTFEVYSAAGKRQYGLNQSPEHPIVWPLSMVVSADDAMAMEVKISIDLAKRVPVSIE